MLKLIEADGNNDYEIGFKVGLHFKEYLSKIITPYNTALQKDNVISHITELERNLSINHNKILQEIYGRADGANISRQAMLLLLFPELYKKTDGCTTLIFRRNNGSLLFAHNEDSSVFCTENIALIKYEYKDHWIIGYTFAEKLAGNSFAYNSMGLFFSGNYLYDNNQNLNQMPRYIFVREILNSKSVEDAIEKFNKIKIASSFSMNIVDLKTNRAVNIEKDINNIYITEIKDFYARSNHFLLKNQDVIKPVSSVFRHKKANELLPALNKSEVQSEDLLKILQYEGSEYDNSIFRDLHKYYNKSVTTASFCVDTETGKITIIDYVKNSTLILTYNK